MSGDETSEPPDIFSATRLIWNRWLGDLSVAMDGYMRTAWFLEWMKYGLRAVSDTRKFHAPGLARRIDERQQDKANVSR